MDPMGIVFFNHRDWISIDEYDKHDKEDNPYTARLC